MTFPDKPDDDRPDELEDAVGREGATPDSESAGESGQDLDVEAPDELTLGDEDLLSDEIEGDRAPEGTGPPPADEPVDVLSSLIAAAGLPEQPAERLDRYRLELHGETDRGRIAVLEHEIGVILERAGDQPGSIKAYARSLTADPTLRPNLWAVRRAFTRGDLWERLIKLLDAEARHARDPEDRALILLEQGYTYEDRLADAAHARECYENASALATGTDAIWPLWCLVAACGDAAAERTALEALAARTVHPGRRAALLVELARADEAAGEIDAALSRLSEASALGVDDARILDIKEVLSGRLGRTDLILETLAEKTQRARAALDRANAEAGRDLALVRSALTLAVRREAACARASGRVELAVTVLEDALRILPDEALLAEDLLEALEEGNDADALADRLRRRLETAQPVERGRLRHALVQSLVRSGRTSDADTVLTEALAETPTSLPLLALREIRALAAGSTELLLDVYRRHAELATTTTSAGAKEWAAVSWTKAAALERRLGQGGNARAALDRALALVPGYLPAEVLREELLAREGENAARIALLRAQSSRLEARARAATLERAAALELDRNGSAEAALGLVDDALDAAPDDRRLSCLRIEILGRLNRHAEMVDGLQALAAITPSSEVAADLLVIAGLALEDTATDAQGLGAARALYRRALWRAPGHAAARTALEVSSERTADMLGLATLLSDEGGTLDDTAGRLLAGATLYEAAGQSEQALGVARSAMNKGGGRRAARMLQRLAKSPEERVAALQAEATHTDETQRSGVLIRLGEALERQGSIDGALQAYTQAVSENAGERREIDVEALLAIAELAAAQGRGKDAALALDRLGETVPEDQPLLRAALLLSSTGLRARNDISSALKAPRAGGPIAALESGLLAWQRAALDHDDHAVAVALEDCERAASSAPAKAAFALRAHAARVRAGELDGGGGAARAFSATPVDPAAAFNAYQADPEPAVRAAVCEARAGRAEGRIRAALLTEAGEGHEERGDVADAARCYQAALALERDWPAALEGLRRVAQSSRAQEIEAGATLRLAELVRDGRRAADLFTAAGDVLKALGRPLEAAAAYRRALDLTPDDDGVGERLCEVLRGERALDHLLDALTIRIDAPALLDARAVDPSRAALYSERAGIYRSLGDLDRAIEDYQRALDLRSDDGADLVALADLLEERGEPAAAADLLERAAALSSDSEQAGSLRLRLAKLAGDRLHDLERAIEEAGLAVDLLSDRNDALECLAGWQERSGNLRAAAQSLVRLGERQAGSQKGGSQLRASALFLAANERRSAREALEAAVGADPINVDAVIGLADVIEDLVERRILLDDALGRQRRALSTAFSISSVTAIERIARAKGDEALAELAGTVSALAGGAKMDTPRALPPLPSGALTDDQARRLRETVGDGLAEQAYVHLSEAAAAVLAADVGASGLQKSDRVPAKQLASRVPIVAKAQAFFGVGELEAWLSPGRPDDCEALVGGLRLRVGTNLADGTAPGARFRVARAVALLRNGTAAIASASPEDLRACFAAAVRLADARLPETLKGASEERVAAFVRAVPRRERKALELLSERLASETFDLLRFRLGVELNAAKQALLFSGDLASALASFQVGDPEAVGSASSAGFERLAAFALSGEYADLAREVRG